MYITRRLPYLVCAKTHNALSPWSSWTGIKPLPTVDTKCLLAVLRRYTVPENVIQIREALVHYPIAETTIQGACSELGARYGHSTRVCALPF